MPVIARFYGIIIKMYFREHGVAHIHAIYNEYNGIFELKTTSMIEGDLPPKAKALVIEWLNIYKNELLAMWDSNEIKKLPGLE